MKFTIDENGNMFLNDLLLDDVKSYLLKNSAQCDRAELTVVLDVTVGSIGTELKK